MKRWISTLLTAAMVFNFAAQCPLITAKAAEPAASSSDALAALGIDTSVAPDGYDPYSLDNPYGRDTIAVTPVYELYTIGWDKSIEDAMSQTLDHTKSSSPESGTKTVNLSPNALDATNILQSRLYGHKQWNATTSSAILDSPDPLGSYNGRTFVSADYTIVTDGTFDMSAPTATPTKGYLLGPTNVTTFLDDGTSYAMADVAAGKFNSDKNTLSSQIAMVYAGAYNKNGGLYLRFGDATTGQYGKPITLIPTGKEIGNPTLKLTNEDGSDSGKLAENFAENPYQLKNYLQVATGDWNGDGIDEVAVYIPEVGNSRIVVYALQKLSSDENDAYKDPSKWGVAWTYPLREGNVVSNMVSLVSGDVDQDGIDDLACTWGYYYGPEQNLGSRAVVMFGGKDTDILKRSQEFSLNYGSSNLVRASFAFGDLAGSGEESLILCGQSDSDLKSGKDSRYVALYTWNGSGFTSSMAQNFVLFEKDNDGKYTWSAMSSDVREKDTTSPYYDHFFSLPLMAANTAIIDRPIQGDTVDRADGTKAQIHGSLLYFDSLIISYGDNGLSIDESWDNSSALPGGSQKDYVEYSAAAGDLTGQTGAGTLFTMSQTLSDHPSKQAKYTVTGTHREPIFEKVTYYKNWFCKLFKIPSYTWKFTGKYKDVTDSKDVAVDYSGYTPSETYLTAVARSEEVRKGGPHYSKKDQVNSSYALCLANTDNDSSYMNYAGKHYYTYTDPQVLAVLASPPYFADLLDRDDLSGNYAESTTSYSSSTGSGGGSTGSTTISVGAYVSYEQDIKIFGVTIASWEAEATITAGFTWETEHTSTLEQTVTYSATSGEDKVAFYSIPMEIYEYTSYVPDGKGGYDEVITAVNIPHEASVRLLNLDDYEAIAEDYSVLPSISGSVLTHTLGDPASYPSNTTSSGKKIAEYEGDPASVGFTAAGGGSTITQEIAMSDEKQNSYTGFATVDSKLGVGAGGVKVGVVAGFEGGGGTVKISTSGSSFSGELQDMPMEAKNYGYAMNWRIFCYQYKQGKTSFPVVSYAVTEVQRPAPLPTDFQQDIAETTAESVTLTWTYDKPVSGFQLYRYYDFPDGSGSYRLKYVPFSAGTKNSDGTYTFSYKDEGLSPYTEYFYQIQTESSYDPKVSIYSEPLSCRTKTEVGYPTITVEGLDSDGNLPIYPDADGKATVYVADEDSYKGLSYQWQKLSGSDWVDISGAKSASYTISNASAADQGTYRCRVNAIYFHEQSQKEFSISAYSDAFTTAYSKRTPSAVLTVKGEKVQSGATAVGKLHAEIELHSANVNNTTAPTGYVTFTITGTDYECSRVVDLIRSSTQKPFDGQSKYYSTASLDLTGLADGAYTVTAYYSGDRVFKDLMDDTGEVAVIGNATGYRLTLAKTEGGSSVTKFTYGDSIVPALFSVTPTSVGYVPVTEGVTYRIVTAGTDGTNSKDILVDNFSSGSKVPSVGDYTFQALVNGEVVADTDITVSPRPVTVYIPSQDNVTANEVTNHPPVLKGDGLTPEELAALNLTYKATNSAGNEIEELKNGMDPGNYTVTPCPSDTTPADLYQNYTITYVSGTYTVIGLTYRLTVEAQEYTDKAGSRAVGTAGISTGGTASDYSANTVVQLYAQPNDGYMVDHWTVQIGSADATTSSGDANNPNRLTITTEPAPTVVKVYFKVKPIVLTAATDKGGRVDCTSDEYFTSGANVTSNAEYTFMAVPAEGYHFSGWQLGVEGTSTTYPAGTDNGDGTNSLTITVGTNSVALKAVFERDSYTLTLEGEITAHYMRQNPADPTGPQIETNIVSGASIPGDTVITAQPKTGYQAAEGAEFVLNGEATGESVSYTFSLTANSILSLETQRNRYAVKVDDAANGSVTVLVDGQPAQGDALNEVEGGSAITFTAKAERGYHFDHWTVNRVDDSKSGDTLTVGALGQDMDVTAVFTASKEYTAAGTVSPASRGTMLYTLYDIYGGVVGEAESELPDTLTLYEGESILFKVRTNPGSMVEQWDCNGSATVSTAKTYPGGKLTADNTTAPDGKITVKAYLVGSSRYEVGYAALNNGALSAKADGEPFDSMDLVSGGSDLTFTAAPNDGYMVDHWTVTQGKLGDDETTQHYQTGDLDVVDPVLTLEGLRTHTTVRVHFTAVQTNQVTLNADTGAAAITYVTPLTANDNGTRNSSTEQVRTGGTVDLTLTPAEGYLPKTDLQKAISDKINSDAQVAVTESGGIYTVTIRGLNSELSLAMSDLFVKTYAITLPEHVTADVSRAAEGKTVTLTVTPASNYALSALTLSAGTLNETVSASTLTYTFTMPAEDVTVTASFTYQGGGSGGGGGAGGGGGGSVAPTPEVKPGSSTVSTPGGESISAEVKVSGGTATVTVDQKELSGIAADQNGLTLDLSGEKNAASAAMDSQTFLALSQAAGSSLTVKLPGGSAVLDQAVLSSLTRSVQEGGTVSIIVAPQTHSGLTSAQRGIVPASAAIAEVTLTVTSPDGTVQVIHDLGGTAELSLPYTLKSGETGERLAVYYLPDTGAAEKIPCTYDSAAGAVTFRTGHFSTFLVVHEYSKPFADITLGRWYYDGVNNALANGWFSGVSADTFAPDSSMTRAMLVTVLYRMSGSPAANGTSAFADVSSGAWYARAVAWAAENQLVSGYEDGTFRPDLAITRQQMAAILYRYHSWAGSTPASGGSLSAYRDAADVAPWALNAMSWANASGLIQGTGPDTLTPNGTATRAQVAVILTGYTKQAQK